METNNAISIRNLNLHYGKNHVLKNINLDIPSKKITAIIGPSGCGKTTLLKCFNRLIEMTDDVKISGQVFVAGDDIYAAGTEVTEIRRRMGLLSQRPSPLPMSIYGNVAYGPKIHGERRKKELDRIVEHYLKEASLWDEVKDRLHMPAARLSIGQQQRLCLARGLAVDPDIILGDEPTSALDPVSSHHIEKKFIELKEKYSIIVVTHILRQAKRIADYLVYIHMGEIIEAGPAKEILENPKEKKTQDYVFGVIS
jgi:phosphate transport system ATP-binding protein